jgi:hypothetical protein
VSIPRHVSNESSGISSIAKRWSENLNRSTADPEYREDWYMQQCGACTFWFPLAGKMGADYGACANARSPFDGRVRFEHDGCTEYSDAGKWIVPQDFE